MIPHFHPHQLDSLKTSLRRDLNLPADFSAGSLDVQGIADVATLSAMHSTRYVATGHLLRLMVGLPVPKAEGDDFWLRMWRDSGSSYLNQTNLKHHVLRAMDGDGASLSFMWLNALGEMDDAQRSATAGLISEALDETTDLGRLDGVSMGELWLRDVEVTAWRILYVNYLKDDLSEDAFRDGWRDA